MTTGAAVNKYLLEREREVIVVRRHLAVLISPAAGALGGFLVTSAMSATILHTNKPLLILVWVLSGFLFLRLISDVASWLADHFVVTSERLLLICGSPTRKIETIPLTKITDMSCERSTAGRLFGYGKFIVESADQRQKLRNIDYIPRPEQIYLEICNLIYPANINGRGHPGRADVD